MRPRFGTDPCCHSPLLAAAFVKVVITAIAAYGLQLLSER